MNNLNGWRVLGWYVSGFGPAFFLGQIVYFFLPSRWPVAVDDFAQALAVSIGITCFEGVAWAILTYLLVIGLSRFEKLRRMSIYPILFSLVFACIIGRFFFHVIFFIGGEGWSRTEASVIELALPHIMGVLAGGLMLSLKVYLTVRPKRSAPISSKDRS